MEKPPRVGPPRKARDPFSDSRLTALAQLLILLFNLLPARVARALGRLIGSLLWRLDGKHRRQVRWHMDLAFRDQLPATEKERLCRAYFRHMGLAIVEFARLRQLTRANLDQHADLSACKTFDELLARGRGVIAVPAHHGNWELCGYAVALKGYALKSVARPLDNESLNDLIKEHRQRSGNELIDKWKVLWKLKKILDRNGILTLSIDQNGGAGGLFVPFFGTMASTITSPAELHLATRAPIVVATMSRDADEIRHTFKIWEVIEHASTGDHQADVKAVIMRINAAYERLIRANPEQWLWVHKRWKTRPPGEVAGADGLPPRAGT